MLPERDPGRFTDTPPLTDAKVVFLREIDGGYNTHVMDANGAHEHRTAGLPDEASICGRNIVYGEQTVNVLVLRASATKLVTGPGENGRPKCSPGRFEDRLRQRPRWQPRDLCHERGRDQSASGDIHLRGRG